MARYDALHNRQTDSRSTKFFRSVQALEDPKERVRIAHVESGPIVIHLVDGLATFDSAADPDSRLRALRAVLQGVADEVAPDLTHDGRISRDGRQLGDLENRTRTRVQRLHLDCRRIS